MKLLAGITRRRVLVVLILVSCVTLALGQGAAERLRHLLGPILAPLGDAGMYLTVAMRTNITAATDPGMSVEEQARLRRQCETLRHSALYWKQASENAQRQLDAMLGFQKSYGPAKGLPCELIPARVVGEASLPYDQVRSLNVGRESGAGPGELVLVTDRSKAMPSELAVISASALVGRVTSAGPFSARIMLVTDRRFRTRARIRRLLDPDHPREIRLTDEGRARVELLNEQNNRPITVEAVGDGAGGLVIADVWRYDNVLPGDLVAAAEGPFLPLEVRIGDVEEVRPDPKHPDRVIVSVRPETDLGTLRDVFIVNTFTAGAGAAAGRR
ncbi:MAG: rod shape-determining protein MreC [Phycisphaerae bacterium]|nr:rod shape-determining protein MreC [Phycisphaerae bacterium]